MGAIQLPNLKTSIRDLPYGISQDLGDTKFVGKQVMSRSQIGSKLKNGKIGCRKARSRAAYNSRLKMPGTIFFRQCTRVLRRGEMHIGTHFSSVFAVRPRTRDYDIL
jgi:hypothetical protein